MFALVVRFDLLPDRVAEFDRLTDETVRAIASEEPGTLLYLCHAVEGEKPARVFFEVYRDRAAFDDHERTAHVRRFLDARKAFLAGPARVEFLSLTTGKGLPSP